MPHTRTEKHQQQNQPPKPVQVVLDKPAVTSKIGKDSVKMHFRCKKSFKDYTFEEISQYFEFPIREVSEQLGVSVTFLKKVCRRLNIPRWPFRKIQALHKRIHQIEETISEKGNPTPSPMSQEELKAKQQLLSSLQVTQRSSQGNHYVSGEEDCEGEDGHEDDDNSFFGRQGPIGNSNCVNEAPIVGDSTPPVDNVCMRGESKRSTNSQQQEQGKQLKWSLHQYVPEVSPASGVCAPFYDARKDALNYQPTPVQQQQSQYFRQVHYDQQTKHQQQQSIQPISALQENPSISQDCMYNTLSDRKAKNIPNMACLPPQTPTTSHTHNYYYHQYHQCMPPSTTLAASIYHQHTPVYPPASGIQAQPVLTSLAPLQQEELHPIGQYVEAPPPPLSIQRSQHYGTVAKQQGQLPSFSALCKYIGV